MDTKNIINTMENIIDKKLKETDDLIENGAKFYTRKEAEVYSCSLKKGYESFMSLREDAKINGTMGMSLDEINEEIRLAREEIRNKKSCK